MNSTGTSHRLLRRITGAGSDTSRPDAETSDRLRAVLHNCARHGPSTQNREGVPAFEQHLRGRVAWVAQHDPGRGARLRDALDAVDWTR